MYNNLFSEITLKGLTLKNRLTMAPLYLGYAGEGGTVTDILLEHYRLMAGSGVAMKGHPAFCVAWPAEKMKEWKAKFV